MGHHLTSIIFHALNTFLVVVLIYRLIIHALYEKHSPPFSERGKRSRTSSLIAGAVTGLLFGLHPLHVESVAWVAEKKGRALRVLSSFEYTLVSKVCLSAYHPSAVTVFASCFLSFLCLVSQWP
jgi:hypothetical protein